MTIVCGGTQSVWRLNHGVTTRVRPAVALSHRFCVYGVLLCLAPGCTPGSSGGTDESGSGSTGASESLSDSTSTTDVDGGLDETEDGDSSSDSDSDSDSESNSDSDSGDTEDDAFRCRSHADCSGASPTCSELGTCVQCTAAHPFACSGGVPQCDPETNTCQACDSPILFDDAALETAVAQALGISDGPITPFDVAGFEALDARNRGITSLVGLECLRDLDTVDLGRNDIDDLWPLATKGGITHLVLDDNAITDLTPLSHSTQLVTLLLRGNTISDLTALADLTNLVTLLLSDNDVGEIDALAGLTNLDQLDLNNNQVEDLSAVENLSVLRRLTANGNNIADVGPVAGLSVLQTLHLSDNNISDVSPVGELPELWFLRLRDNAINDLSPLVPLASAHLVSLDVRGNPFDCDAHANNLALLAGETGGTVLHDCP